MNKRRNWLKWDKYYYATGLNKQLRHNLNDFKKLVLNKHKPVMIVIDGGLGSGKSTTAETIAKYIQPGFNPEIQVGRGVAEFAEAWERTEQLEVDDKTVKCCVFDEAQGFDRSQGRTKLNTALRNFFYTFRDAKTIIILVLPHFSRLDPSIYETKAVQCLIHILETHNTYIDYSCYDLYSILRMVDFLSYNNKQKFLSKMTVYHKFTPNFYGHIRKPKEKTQSFIDEQSTIGKKDLRKKMLDIVKQETSVSVND